MMKKWIVLLFILSMILKLNAQTGIAITVIVAPAPGAAITMDSQLWNILLANDGITTYQNDHQGTMTIKSSAVKNYRVDFSSQNLGRLKQGTDYITYYIKATAITGRNIGLVGPPTVAGYVQLAGVESMQFNKKTHKDDTQFYIGIKMDPIAGQFYESRSYSDILTITFNAIQIVHIQDGSNLGIAQISEWPKCNRSALPGAWYCLVNQVPGAETHAHAGNARQCEQNGKRRFGANH